MWYGTGVQRGTGLTVTVTGRTPEEVRVNAFGRMYAVDIKDIHESTHECGSCGSTGFFPSRMRGLCTFCDGTEGGYRLTEKEIDEWNSR